MKPLTCLIVLFLLISCKKDAVQTDLELSREIWLAFKKSANNNYSYTVKSESWAGFGDSTIISVSKGNVSGRKYTSYTLDGQTGQKTVRDSWTETGTSLNTHPQGAATLNMDVVYEKAAKEWLRVDPKQNMIYFEVKNRGMISTCGFVNKGCMDDCFRGIKISNISAEQNVR